MGGGFLCVAGGLGEDGHSHEVGVVKIGFIKGNLVRFSPESLHGGELFGEDGRYGEDVSANLEPRSHGDCFDGFGGDRCSHVDVFHRSVW